MEAEAKKERSESRLYSDFMLDPRKKRFEVEFYSTITNKLAKGSPVTFRRISIALGMVMGSVLFGMGLFNLKMVYQKSLLFLPFILLTGSSVYVARQYLIRVGNSSKIGYALNYLLSEKTKAAAPDNKLFVASYEELAGIGVAILENRCRVIGYAVEGNFTKTMFQSDVEFLRANLSLLRDRLDGIVEVGVLSIENTDFQDQKDYYNKCSEAGGYAYYLAKNLEYNIGIDNKFEKIEKKLLFFVLRNDQDFDKVVEVHIPRLLSNQILRKAQPLTQSELENFVNNW